jgi:Transposase/DDE superfamily endonuclease
MRIIGCDLHARQQTLAMLETTTGEVVNLTLMHEGNEVRDFYSQLPRPVLVGIEATGSMQWFLNLMEELGIECRVGHPATIRAAEPRKQKHDRRDAELILKLLMEKRFPAIWLPTKELLDLRALLLHRHQWVRRPVTDFLAMHPKVHLHFTPTYSSWLNQVELWFSKIDRDVIARGVFTSVPDLKRKLLRYIRHYNKSLRTVKWKYADPSRHLSSQSVGTGH